MFKENHQHYLKIFAVVALWVFISYCYVKKGIKYIFIIILIVLFRLATTSPVAYLLFVTQILSCCCGSAPCSCRILQTVIKSTLKSNMQDVNTIWLCPVSDFHGHGRSCLIRVSSPSVRPRISTIKVRLDHMSPLNISATRRALMIKVVALPEIEVYCLSTIISP